MKTNNIAFVGYGLLLLGLIAAPFLGAYPIFVMKLMCFALFASAFNLLLGYTGLLSFGHAAFLGGAAYVAGHAIKVWGLTPEVGLLLGTAGGALLGLLFGWLAIRRQGIYFSMITLALAQMLFFVCLQAPFTGGEDGLQGVPRGKLFGLIDLKDDLVMYYVALVIVAAALAGLAGSLKTLVLGFATLSDVHWTASGQVILMTLVGGLGTLSGPLIGSAVVVLLENKIGDLGEFLARVSGIEWFHTLGESVTIVTGLIFVVCVLAFRRGIMGELIAWIARRRAGSAAK